MRYNRVYLDAIGYELPPVVVSSADLEARLQPVYERLRMPAGQLEALTGIHERRWWEADFPISQGAILAGRKALAMSNVSARDVGVLIYAGVCREQFEPATACQIAAALGVSHHAAVFDVSNACLGMLNGIVDVANRIELGQVRAGLVVSCETAREINEAMIERMLSVPNMDTFKSSLATLTGGSGAAAVLVTDGGFAPKKRRKLVGGVTENAPQHHDLCRWGLTKLPVAFQRALESDAAGLVKSTVEFGMKHVVTPIMATDAVAVLKHGVELGTKTFGRFASKLGWGRDQVDKVICHQVGSGHRDAILKSLGIDPAKEFSTYEFLGNIGTVSLPITAALAEERDFLHEGDRVGFLGIGSGLNCLMLGVQW